MNNNCSTCQTPTQSIHYCDKCKKPYPADVCSNCGTDTTPAYHCQICQKTYLQSNNHRAALITQQETTQPADIVTEREVITLESLQTQINELKSRVKNVGAVIGFIGLLVVLFGMILGPNLLVIVMGLIMLGLGLVIATEPKPSGL